MNFKFKKGIIVGTTALGFLLVGQTGAHAATYSVVDYLAGQGQDYSFEHRADLANKYGITNYRGTANQNLALLEKLQGRSVSSQEARTEVVSTPKVDSHYSSSRTLTMVATAYTANCAGGSGVTATGIDLKANPNQKVIAVDPNVIPLGSKVYVEGYGTAIAADTGGAIKGNRIDVFIPDYRSAVAFGRKTVQVDILK